jgi:rod shape determining protein RodA
LPAVDRRLIQNFEWPLLGLAFGLVLLGIVNLISAAPEQTEGIPATAWRQIGWLPLAFGAMVAVMIPDYRRLERAAIPVYLVIVALLGAVLLFAPVVKGSQRWLVLGPVRMQPAELAKIALILLCARILARRATAPELRLRDLLLPGILIGIPIVLVLREPDLGTALLMSLIALSYLPFSKIRTQSLAWLAAAAVAAAGTAWFFVLHDYQKRRVLTFLDPDRDPLGSAYHAIQSQIAVGSGGLLGKGWMSGSQSQLDFLPEQQTDFVFSVLAEEWGFIGAALVLAVFLALLVRGLVIARASKDLFGCYLGIGVVAFLFWPAVINVGMVIGLAPVVGVALPLLSYGGSSLVTTLIGVGLLMNVSMRRYLF